MRPPQYLGIRCLDLTRLDTEQWGSWKNSTISQDSSQLARQSTGTVRVKTINLAITRMMAKQSHQGTGGSGKGSGMRKGFRNPGLVLGVTF